MSDFLLWMDDGKSKPVSERILDGAARYRERMGQQANVCLVNERDAGVEVEGIAVRPSPVAGPNYYFLGREERGK